MQTKLVAINSITPNANNPRIIKDEKFNKLVKSIAEFPKMLQLRPIVVDADNIVLGGNMRLKACKEAGLKEVYIIEAKDLTDSEQQQFIIKDNVGFGEWDWDLLANEWDAEELKDWGLDLPAFGNKGAENKDLSDSLKETFEIIISAPNEQEQEIIYNRLIKEGYTCRVLTL